jgi:hypothetical protein
MLHHTGSLVPRNFALLYGNITLEALRIVY